MAKTEKQSTALQPISRPLYWALLVLCAFPFEQVFGKEHTLITPPIALFLGLMFAIVFGIPCPKANKKISKYLLQASVVGLGFGMNLIDSLKSGAEGMMFTIVSVVGVMGLGVIAASYLGINRKTGYLISSGTAICGGSAIAAVGGVLKANADQMAVSLGVIFILNAIALFIFPPMGEFFNMSQQQFGTWAAIAIHDTSSVVGAGEAYGAEACQIATLIKCTRALWIIPLAFFTMWAFRNDLRGGEGKAKVSIPWFILLFVVAMVINTYAPENLHPVFTVLVAIAKRALVAVLFAIGAGLSIKVVRQVGVKPLILAVGLWIAIGASSLAVVLYTIS